MELLYDVMDCSKNIFRQMLQLRQPVKADINALLSASESYMLERQEASEIIEEVRSAIKDWRKTAAELQIPIKLLESYSIRWDEL